MTKALDVFVDDDAAEIAVSRMTPNQWDVFRMTVRGISTSEIAKVIGKKHYAVKSAKYYLAGKLQVDPKDWWRIYCPVMLLAQRGQIDIPVK